MLTDRIIFLANSGGVCRIFTPFGEATGRFIFCDGEECHFLRQPGNIFKFYCVDVLGLEEF